MSCCDEKDFCIELGETFAPVIRYGTGVITSKAITGISQAAPAVVTAVTHGVPDGWQVAVVGARGMTQVNATRYPPQGNDWMKATVLTADTVQLNSVSSADFSAYTSGGFLVYSTPVSLSSATATFKVWDNPGKTGAPLVSLTQALGITLDDTAKTITPTFQTTSLTWTLGYYDLDLTDSGGTVRQVLEGTITID